MFELNGFYKIEIKAGTERNKIIFYTGIIKEEDEILIRILTIRDETVIINKKDIIRSTLIKRNIGGRG